MTPIDSIVNITGHVLIHIGRTILGEQPEPAALPDIVVRLDCPHHHDTQPVTARYPRFYRGARKP